MLTKRKDKDSFKDRKSTRIHDHSGQFVNGKLFNKTRVIFKNGDEYRGNFKDGRPSGFGTITYNGTIICRDPQKLQSGQETEDGQYGGQFKAGKREGQGTMTWPADGS